MFLRLRKKTRVGDLVPGKIACVKGIVQCERLVAIPSSGTRCAYFFYTEERYKRGARGQGRPLWLPERSNSECAPFGIVDESGDVQVRVKGEQIQVSGLHREMGLVKGNKKRRFFAEYLEPGDVVIARGMVSKPPSDQPLHLEPTPKARLSLIVVSR